MTDVHQVNKLHDTAMDEAEYAFMARRRGDEAKAQGHFRKAYELEAQAAHLVASLETEPTRSVLHRSAASLAYNCGEYREAEKLIATALLGNPPKEIATELRDLMRLVLDAFKEKAIGI
jgi:hypothetical protein